MSDKPSDILARAADILMERGWAQGIAERDGRVCLARAIGYASSDAKLVNWDAISFVTEAVGGPIIYFNEAKSTTFDMVIGVLHDAQLAAKEAGQ